MNEEVEFVLDATKEGMNAAIAHLRTRIFKD